MTYMEFLNRKLAKPVFTGLKKVGYLHKSLFDFQRNCVEAALLHGRFALFLDTGLGKTICQLEYCRQLPGKSLILAPLAVAEQTRREAANRLDMEVHHSRDGSVKSKVTVTNYERIHLFDLSQFEVVVLDESSILKSYDGATRNFLCDSFSRFLWKLPCTATPAPNDYTELGNHSEFLGVMPMSDMLHRWFTHDSQNTCKWRVKGHGIKPFWEWVGSWAACVEKPSDAGGDDSPFNLPPLDIQLSQVETDYNINRDGNLFRIPETSAISIRREKKLSIAQRIERVVALCESDQPHIVWCETNEESDLISKALGDRCVEVKGSDSIDKKEESLEAFSLGFVPIIVSKASICGHGLNWQHCHHQVFASLSYSCESFYQAVRRSWRFGQKKPVRIDVVLSETEMPLWQTVSRKMSSHRGMKDSMKFGRIAQHYVTKVKVCYNPTHKGKLPQWLQSKAA